MLSAFQNQLYISGHGTARPVMRARSISVLNGCEMLLPKKKKTYFLRVTHFDKCDVPSTTLSGLDGTWLANNLDLAPIRISRSVRCLFFLSRPVVEEPILASGSERTSRDRNDFFEISESTSSRSEEPSSSYHKAT